ncbi:IS982 family transposase [Chloroflexus aggregans]|uniref:Transposase IS4 family protein n=1 Tax=Chloroflexus aggregans (strain MD-66 / DSM 9485) TaxID=326427 RepID=B8G985_CHLAD|nr:IS982 family transposase [Chloroflexus aggregans]ACL24375.1 transposase IS4 family protein [Chloroflexus aggregans DSM 9485]
MDSLIELFCDVDDCCQSLLPVWRNHLLSAGDIQRQRERSLSVSELMTILIHFHQSHYRHFKASYTDYVLERLRAACPGLVRYNRFVALIPSVLVPLCGYLRPRCFGTCTGIAGIDATALAVCNNPRIHAHKVCAGLAARGNTATDWVFGCKRHLVCNDRGEFLNRMLTPGNVDDRKPVPTLVRKRFGTLFGAKGSLSKALRDELFRTFSVELVPGVRSHMKHALMLLMDNILRRKRAIVETIIDQRKNIAQIAHARHRSPVNVLVNLLCGVIAYCRQPKKPSLGLGTLPALIA